MKETRLNRYVVLAALFVNSFCIGGVYAWSVFSLPLAEIRGWDYGQVTLAYSMMLLGIAIVGIPGGRLLDRFGPKRLMLASSALFGFGWMLTGFAPNLGCLYLFFGVCCGAGSGLRYNPCITTAVRWFPDKKGFASGLVVGAMGLAPLALAPVANALLVRYDVLTAFKVLGLVFFAASAIASLLVSTPPEGWLPEGYRPPAETAVGGDGCTWREMLRNKKFYLLWLMFFGSCIAGLMLIGHASAIGQELVGMTGAQAAVLVGIMAVANFAGRMVMGTMSDYIGRYLTVIICLAVSLADMFLLSGSRTYTAFLIAIIIVGVAFGGILSVFPTIVSDTFGLKHMGLNYGILFTAYGIAAIAGPMAATTLKSYAGTYQGAFFFAGLCSGIALLLAVIIFCLSKAVKRGMQVLHDSSGQ